MNNNDVNIVMIDDAKRAYKFLLQVRDLDNELMWTRSNVVLLVQGGILAVLSTQFQNLIDHFKPVLLLLSFFGFISSFLWMLISIGGSFWVDYWEKQLAEIEEIVTGNVPIFRKHPHTDVIKQKGYVSTRKTFLLIAYIAVLAWTSFCTWVVYLIFYSPN